MYWLAAAELVTINGQVQGILFILVVGAATDCSLLYTARYRDALLHHRRRGDATRAALAGTVEPVLASGATLIAGLLCLLLSDLAANQALGPVAAVGIVLAALTFLPVGPWAAGRGAFWPFRPAHDPFRAERVRVVDRGDAGRPTVEGRGVRAFVARFVARRPRAVRVVTTVVLLVPAGFSAQFEASSVAQGRYQLQVVLAGTAGSAAAEEAVCGLRERLRGIDGEILVGGTTATTIDTDETAIAGRTLILVVVALILMVLLRAVLAPVLLVLTTVVSFAAALGVSAVAFDHVLGFPGADPSVPLYGFVFLVALGVDCTIFLMARVQEEARAHGTRAGGLRGLTLTGGVITSAGVVLAATFAALAVIPIMFLVQLAFLVAFGVLLDALVVRSLLVPALTYDLGRAAWWPFARRIGP